MMKVVLLVVLLIAAATCQSLQLKSRSKQHFVVTNLANATVADAASFDFYMLVLQWDPKLSTSFFTIHGLWPENQDGTYPENCPGPRFNVSAISDLVPTLNTVWPSNSGSNSAFWQHEWEKHGTCSTFPEYAFFLNTINLQAKYNVKAALERASIIPGTKTYTTASINLAVQNYIGALPALHCSSSKLVEVALCITKSLTLANCPTSLGSYFKCPSTVTYN